MGSSEPGTRLPVLDKELPLVNSWTEFGELDYICVGSCLNACYPDKDPGYSGNRVLDDFLARYIEKPLDPRPKDRILRAEAELRSLVGILEAESVQVGSVQEVNEDIRQELLRKRSWTSTLPPSNIQEDRRIKKTAVQTCRPSPARFDQNLQTPWFKSQFQFGLACPRDLFITLGNTVLEAATASRSRYFESKQMQNIVYGLWNADRRVHWKTAPKPSCADSLYDLSVFEDAKKQNISFAQSGYRTVLNEAEVAFDAADMMRVGRDVFYKRSASANVKGLDWLRREFPDLRFHLLHFPSNSSAHLDTSLVPIRPPTPGSEGIVLINQQNPPLESEMKLWTRNGWSPRWSPLPATQSLSPVAICSSSLNLNLLSLSPKLVLIEESELPLFHFLDDLGMDVITVPLRTLNEFGGGVHCVTWDIRRNEGCQDYFPNQDYDAECELNYSAFFDDVQFPKLRPT